MKCPSCSLALEDGAAECPNCGLSKDSLDRKCGVLPFLPQRVVAASADLTMKELTKIIRSTAKFEAEFPGVLIIVLSIQIPKAVSPSEYGFWLLNRIKIGPSVAPSRSYVAAFLLDRSRQCVSITLSFGLENFFSREDLREVLSAGNDLLAKNRPDAAIVQCIEKLSAILHRRLSAPVVAS